MIVPDIFIQGQSMNAYTVIAIDDPDAVQTILVRAILVLNILFQSSIAIN